MNGKDNTIQAALSISAAHTVMLSTKFGWQTVDFRNFNTMVHFKRLTGYNTSVHYPTESVKFPQTSSRIWTG